MQLAYTIFICKYKLEGGPNRPEAFARTIERFQTIGTTNRTFCRTKLGCVGVADIRVIIGIQVLMIGLILRFWTIGDKKNL